MNAAFKIGQLHLRSSFMRAQCCILYHCEYIHHSYKGSEDVMRFDSLWSAVLIVPPAWTTFSKAFITNENTHGGLSLPKSLPQIIL